VQIFWQGCPSLGVPTLVNQTLGLNESTIVANREMAFIRESHSNCPSYVDEGNDMVCVKDEL